MSKLVAEGVIVRVEGGEVNGIPRKGNPIQKPRKTGGCGADVHQVGEVDYSGFIVAIRRLNRGAVEAEGLFLDGNCDSIGIYTVIGVGDGNGVGGLRIGRGIDDGAIFIGDGRPGIVIDPVA